MFYRLLGSQSFHRRRIRLLFPGELPRPLPPHPASSLPLHRLEKKIFFSHIHSSRHKPGVECVRRWQAGCHGWHGTAAERRQVWHLRGICRHETGHDPVHEGVEPEIVGRRGCQHGSPSGYVHCTRIHVCFKPFHARVLLLVIPFPSDWFAIKSPAVHSPVVCCFTGGGGGCQTGKAPTIEWIQYHSS